MATAKKATKKTTSKKPAKKAPAKKPAAKKAAPKKKAPAKKPAKKAAPQEETRRQAQAECGFHEGHDAERGAGGGGRRQGGAAHRGHQEDLGLHQEEQAPGLGQQAQINADDKLKPVFGGKKQVSMFEMTAMVAKHLK